MPATIPMTTSSRNHAARARTSAARTRIPNEEPVFSSMPPSLRPRGAGHGRFSVARGAEPRGHVANGGPSGQLGPREAVAPHPRGGRVADGDRVAALHEHEAGGGGA